MRWQTFWEGRWIFLVLAVAGAGAWFISPWLLLLVVAMIAFSISFFRDPERLVPEDPCTIVSPADGVVTAIEKDAPLPGGGVGWRISIFLSVFNVHVNRAPVAGRVLSCEHVPGKFLDARHPRCHIENESMTWRIAADAPPAPANSEVCVRQITGAIARRIVAWSQEGDALERGHRFGMIRFGSRTDLFLPDAVEVVAAVGQKVQGASTILARWRTNLP